MPSGDTKTVIFYSVDCRSSNRNNCSRRPRLNLSRSGCPGLRLTLTTKVCECGPNHYYQNQLQISTENREKANLFCGRWPSHVVDTFSRKRNEPYKIYTIHSFYNRLHDCPSNNETDSKLTGSGTILSQP